MFNEYCAANDTTGELLVLKNWRKAAPRSADLYIAWFNYYVAKSRQSVLNMAAGPGKPGSLVFTDSRKKVAGYISERVIYNDVLINKGIAYVDTAITRYPNRLDMRFGKIYTLGQVGRFDAFTAELIKTIMHGQQIGMQWKWTDDQPVEDPKTVLLSAEQDYVVQLFNAGDNNARYIKQIAETVLQYYPDNVPNLTNLGIAYLVLKQYNDALTPLIKANTLNPADHVVLNNIGYCYELMHDNANAIKYYKQALKFASADAKPEVEKKIERLENNDDQ